ncbi:hypothetical protein CPS_4274 [Colwellia psychrerythraea 34H]|uniref:Uncharacterized protein n=1 Tax=Colwellia psychrerythraea (strain 34H / ATCC BAA-681) TaxID=167879 RepID=Q47W98_COLP3|nr:hypothetical protein CPS_4274 [Colwellia psychrerythraea 34H]
MDYYTVRELDPKLSLDEVLPFKHSETCILIGNGYIPKRHEGAGFNWN